jgi:hypothetical protein
VRLPDRITALALLQSTTCAVPSTESWRYVQRRLMRQLSINIFWSISDGPHSKAPRELKGHSALPTSSCLNSGMLKCWSNLARDSHYHYLLSRACDQLLSLDPSSSVEQANSGQTSKYLSRLTNLQHPAYDLFEELHSARSADAVAMVVVKEDHQMSRYRTHTAASARLNRHCTLKTPCRKEKERVELRVS